MKEITATHQMSSSCTIRVSSVEVSLPWSIQVCVTATLRRNNISHNLTGATVAAHQSRRDFKAIFHPSIIL